MIPLKIGACLKTSEIADHRDWLFEVVLLFRTGLRLG